MRPRSHKEVELIDIGCHLDIRDQEKEVMEECLRSGHAMVSFKIVWETELARNDSKFNFEQAESEVPMDS